MLEEILKVTGKNISIWMDNLVGELRQNDTIPCLLPMTMKAIGETGWYDQYDELHNKLLWQYCFEGNLTMVKYMLTLPGIMDVEMEDGTTAFVMALAGENLELGSKVVTFRDQNSKTTTIPIDQILTSEIVDGSFIKINFVDLTEDILSFWFRQSTLFR